MQDTLLENDAIGSGLKFDFYDDLQRENSVNKTHYWNLIDGSRLFKTHLKKKFSDQLLIYYVSSNLA